jgi:acyl carrier protein
MTEDQIRDILSRYGDLAVAVGSLAPDADLYHAGLSSFGTVEVMVAMEEHLGTSFPDHLLTRDTFRSIAALCACADQLRTAADHTTAAARQHAQVSLPA